MHEEQLIFKVSSNSLSLVFFINEGLFTPDTKTRLSYKNLLLQKNLLMLLYSLNQDLLNLMNEYL